MLTIKQMKEQAVGLDLVVSGVYWRGVIEICERQEKTNALLGQILETLQKPLTCYTSSGVPVSTVNPGDLSSRSGEVQRR